MLPQGLHRSYDITGNNPGYDRHGVIRASEHELHGREMAHRMSGRVMPDVLRSG
jgi:hypothetical protein